MSFRRQLFLSLAVLVLVPAVVASLAIERVVRANENAKTDARLDSASRVGKVLVEQFTVRAERRSVLLGEDADFRAALRSGKRARIVKVFPTAIEAQTYVGGIIDLGTGEPITTGSTENVGIARIQAPLPDGRTAQISVGLSTVRSFINEVESTTGVSAAILDGTRVVYRSSNFPAAQQVDLSGPAARAADRWRTRQLIVPSMADANYRVVFADNAGFSNNSAVATRLVLGVLAAFILVGLAIGWLLQRALAGRIQSFLGAADRLGSGDFAAAGAIPVKGRGEFATLGRAFVGMARQLELRVDQLERERGRVQSSLLRLGKAFAANLDRDTLVDLVVESAVDGLTADSGRALMPTGPNGTAETRGSVGAVLDSWDALGEVERRALATGASAALTLGGLHAIAEPMQVERGDGPMGVISVARSRAFEPDERELLRYLTEQAAVSLRNVGRHEDVARESITDELTGLFNRRRFDDVLTHAAARATDADPIALVMLDLDRFKVINDTHGHPFGDRVLKAVAKVVRDTARERDLPARYGGEELAVVLATGDTEAARHFAERLREGIQALKLGDDRTGPVEVTASLGVASLPADGDDVGDLVRAADEALYRAKRGGRNRVETPTPAQGPAGEVR
ncbi:MAG: diguanylate cyclase [Solirubrobacteraceae bacterium]|nr:diguanylate cyclase [Solirubrobacteraceae bacterium]